LFLAVTSPFFEIALTLVRFDRCITAFDSRRRTERRPQRFRLNPEHEFDRSAIHEAIRPRGLGSRQPASKKALKSKACSVPSLRRTNPSGTVIPGSLAGISPSASGRPRNSNCDDVRVVSLGHAFSKLPYLECGLIRFHARDRPNERQDKSPKHPRRTNAHRRIPI
jgi:hypothetical protein